MPQRIRNRALAFADKYGLPHHGRSKSLASLLNPADVIRSLIAAKEAERWAELDDCLDSNANKIEFTEARVQRSTVASPEITLRVYADLFKKDDSKAAAINAMFGTN